MRLSIQLLVCVIVVAWSVSSVNAWQVPANPKFSLLGPPARVGRVVRQELLMSLKRAPMQLRFGQKQMKGKADLLFREIEDLTPLRVRGYRIRRFRRKIILNRLRSRLSIGKQRKTELEHSALEERTVIHSRRGRTWKSRLLGWPANPKQLREMEDFEAPVSQRLIYPPKRVAVGKTWKIGKRHFGYLLGSRFHALGGEAELTFKKIVYFQHQMCAKIEVSMRFRGRMSDNEGVPLQVAMTLKGYYLRDLKNGINLKGELKGRMKMRGRFVEGGQRGRIKMEGPILMRFRRSIRM